MNSWRRTQEVDIKRYLPLFIFKDSSVKALNDADSQEHERLRLYINDVLQQLSVHTATWGLNYWEEMLGIIPEEMDMEHRRGEVLTRLNAHISVTPTFLERLANRYLTDSSAKITPHNEKYTFKISYNKESCYDLPSIIRSIEMYKPAHLGFSVEEIRTLETTVIFAGRISISETNIIPQGANYTMAPNSLTSFVGGGIFIYEQTKIGG